MKSILIIEDDTDLLEGLSFSLTGEGYEVEQAASITAAKEKMDRRNYDLLLLDCNLPDGNGFELCREVRTSSDVAVLMLTARDTELDEIKALELGVDDYMSKPFSVGVLKARIKKLLFRSKESKLLVSGKIRVDRSACRVYRENIEIFLGKTEYKLLSYLMENKNQVLSKDQILEHIWDQDGSFVDENIISVNIRRLRKKVETEPNKPQLIKTVHGLGYVWKEL